MQHRVYKSRPANLLREPSCQFQVIEEGGLFYVRNGERILKHLAFKTREEASNLADSLWVNWWKSSTNARPNHW